MATRIVVCGREWFRTRWRENGNLVSRRFATMEEAQKFEDAMRGKIPKTLLMPHGRREATLINLFAGYVSSRQNPYSGLCGQSIVEKGKKRNK